MILAFMEAVEPLLTPILLAPISVLVQATLSNVGALAEKSLVLLGGRGGRCTSPDWVGVMANCCFQAAGYQLRGCCVL